MRAMNANLFLVLLKLTLGACGRRAQDVGDSIYNRVFHAVVYL